MPLQCQAVVKALQRMSRSSKGTAAMEFAIVAPAFLILICVGINLALAMFTQITMDQGLASAARKVKLGMYAGNTGANTDNANSFVAAVCQFQPDIIASCSSSLKSVAVAGDRFRQLANRVPHFQQSGSFDSSVFETGGSGQVMLISIGYRMPYLTPLVGSVIGGTAFLLQSTTTLKIENY